MFGFKRLSKEEKEEKRLKKIKIPLKDLYIVSLGIFDESKPFTKTFKSIGTITIVKHNNSYDSYDNYYKDIITDTNYYLFGNIYLNHGQVCCNKPIPLISIFQECETKCQILKDGYITMYDAINIIKDYNEINNNPTPNNNTEETKTQPTTPTTTSKKEELTEGKILNDKVYPYEPAIGREQELKAVITTLASQKKSPILVGESGTGKTTIVDELVYKIQKNEVPNFLKNKQVIELDTSSIVAETRYRGDFEEKLKKVINYVISNDSLLFIDEIHTIYGAGSSSNDDNDIAEMLKKAIDRENIRVIGTTTSEEYNEYFSKDALKRRFEPIIIKEPNKEILQMITNQTFYNFSNNVNISLDEIESSLNQITEILINSTQNSCRNYNDKVNNPDLIISIIDKAFADARMNDLDSLTINNIIYAVETCSRIYDSIKEKAINELKTLKPKTKSLSSPILQFKKETTL